MDICGREWGVKINLVEFLRDAPHRTRVVDYATASKSGEPYAALIDRKGYVPSVSIHFCSEFHKLETVSCPTPATGWA